MEAMYRILWKLFEEWLVRQANADEILTENLLSSLAAFRSSVSPHCFNNVQRLGELRLLFESFRSFLSFLGFAGCQIVAVVHRNGWYSS